MNMRVISEVGVVSRFGDDYHSGVNSGLFAIQFLCQNLHVFKSNDISFRYFSRFLILDTLLYFMHDSLFGFLHLRSHNWEP